MNCRLCQSLLSFIYLLLASCGQTSDIDAVAKTARNDSSFSGLLEEFPKANESIQAVRYQRAELQGGAYFHVLIHLTADLVKSEYTKKSQKFLYSADGSVGRWIEDGKNLENSRPLALNKFAKKEEPFGPDWSIGIFVCHKKDDSWNHGDVSGMAFNEKAGYIVYFAESW